VCWAPTGHIARVGAHVDVRALTHRPRRDGDASWRARRFGSLRSSYAAARACPEGRSAREGGECEKEKEKVRKGQAGGKKVEESGIQAGQGHLSRKRYSGRPPPPDRSGSLQTTPTWVLASFQIGPNSVTELGTVMARVCRTSLLTSKRPGSQPPGAPPHLSGWCRSAWLRYALRICGGTREVKGYLARVCKHCCSTLGSERGVHNAMRGGPGPSSQSNAPGEAVEPLSCVFVLALATPPPRCQEACVRADAT